MTPTFRLGVIMSSGGSALASAAECLQDAGHKIDWIVITDRECAAESWAQRKGYPMHRIQYKTPEFFSEHADTILSSEGCSAVLLFYSRRISSPLIERKSVWNIHPALLPAFRGLHGIRDALSSGVKIIGATLHRVDEGLDTGPIAAQVAAPLPPNASLEAVNHISYLQKIWLTLIWFEAVSGIRAKEKNSRCSPAVEIACPGLSDERLFNSFSQFVAEK
jgi:phosphoribosylglycinamide formyltransferase-1